MWKKSIPSSMLFSMSMQLGVAAPISCDAERVNWFVTSRVGSSCPKSAMVNWRSGPS